MEKDKKGPGRPPVADGRNITKCFRMTDNTERMLEELQKYYNRDENKKNISIGKVLELLIREKYFELLSSDYNE